MQCASSRPVACSPRPQCARPMQARSPATFRVTRRQGNRLRLQAAAQATPTAAFPRWDFIYRDLSKQGLESLQPEDAAAMVADGRAVLVDVRPKDAFEKGHPEGAVSAPVFQQMDFSQPSFGKLLKTAAMLANGVQPTEYNPRFEELVAAAAAGGKAVILACEAGGTMTATTNFPTGKTSRSLKGCWKVVNSGAVSAGNCYHLEGGVYRWFAAGLPMVGDYDGSNVGRTPAAVDSQKQ